MTFQLLAYVLEMRDEPYSLAKYDQAGTLVCYVCVTYHLHEHLSQETQT